MSEKESIKKVNNISMQLAKKALKRLQDGYSSGGKFIPKATTNADKQCLLHNKAFKERYPKMKIEGPQEYYIHHLVIRAKGEVLNEQLQVSHLCHEKTCINPAHIIQESGHLNRSRQPCSGASLLKVVCSCGCVTIANPCRHEPKCILSSE
jgi:hypothetical protein